MHSVAALFREADAAWVEKTWADLRERFGLEGVARTPVPHLSFDVFAGYDGEALGAVVKSHARRLEPFRVRVSGLGVFPGANPAVYLAVTPTDELLACHQALHGDLGSALQMRSPLYAPGAWVPHVTLVHHDPDLPLLQAALGYLMTQDLPSELEVDALGWIEQRPGEIGRLQARAGFDEDAPEAD